MTLERDDLLDELRAELDVEPSAEFQSRIRNRLVETAGLAGPISFRAWSWVAAGVGAAAVVLLLLPGVLREPRPPADRPEAVAASSPSTAPAFSGVGASSSATPSSSVERRAAPVHVAAGPSATELPATSEDRFELAPLSEFVVDRREVRTWRRMVDGGVSLVARAPILAIDEPVVVTALSVPAEIVVSPIDGSMTTDRSSDVRGNP